MKAEKAVLGTMMKENYLLKETELTAEHFEQQVHKDIFRIMQEQQAKGKGFDSVSLVTYFDPRLIGGAGYVMELAALANEKKFDDYVAVVMDVYRQREKRKTLSIALTEDWEVENIMSELNKIQDGRVDDHHSIFQMTVDIYEKAYEEQKEEKGVPSGIKLLDLMTSGLQNSELIIVAARPSMGKTDVMLHFAKQAGWMNYLPIIFSLEMSAGSLLNRMVASTGGFNRSRMRNPNKQLSEGQKEKWMPTLHRLSDTNIQIFDKSGQTVPEMRMKVRKAASQFPDKKPVIFIDYLTLIKPVVDNGNMHLMVSDITKALKALAKEFDCPVVVLSQLSRKVEQRPDKRPMLSDLRESGSIEEDADVAMFLYRDAYYTKDDSDDKLEIIVAKNRNGGTGTALATYNKHTGGISDRDHP